MRGHPGRLVRPSAEQELGELVLWVKLGGGGYGAAVQIMFMSHVCPHSVNPFGPETFHPEALNP